MNQNHSKSYDTICKTSRNKEACVKAYDWRWIRAHNEKERQPVQREGGGVRRSFTSLTPFLKLLDWLFGSMPSRLPCVLLPSVHGNLSCSEHRGSSSSSSTASSTRLSCINTFEIRLWRPRRSSGYSLLLCEAAFSSLTNFDLLSSATNSGATTMMISLIKMLPHAQFVET